MLNSNILKKEITCLSALLTLQSQDRINHEAGIELLRFFLNKFLRIKINKKRLVDLSAKAGLLNGMIAGQICFNITSNELKYMSKAGFEDVGVLFKAARDLLSQEHLPTIEDLIQRQLEKESWVKDYCVDYYGSLYIKRYQGRWPDEDPERFGLLLRVNTGYDGPITVIDNNGGWGI